MKTLFGGSSSNQQATSASGFAQLPQPIQDSFTNLATQSGNLLAPNGGSPNSSLFTLPSLNSSSNNALSQIQNQDFAITPDSISKNIAMQTNPYDDSVINSIERAQNGSLSQLNAYLTNAGQFGSNRGMLGASDIAQTAADQIGNFKNSEFQTALNNALTTIPQNQSQSAAGSVQAGQTQQQQQMQNQQAPVSALAALSQIMGILPTNGGSTSQSTGSSSANNGIFNSISDIRLKENIMPRGTENGFRVYDFTYKNDERKRLYRGVMAQEVRLTRPDAVEFSNGHYSVNYDKIGVSFREVH